MEARRRSDQLLKKTRLVLPTRVQRGWSSNCGRRPCAATSPCGEFARVLAPGTPADRLRAGIPLATAERGRQRISPDEAAVTHSGSVMRVYADPLRSRQGPQVAIVYRYPIVINRGRASRFDNSLSTPARSPVQSHACPARLSLRGLGAADSQLWVARPAGLSYWTAAESQASWGRRIDCD